MEGISRFMEITKMFPSSLLHLIYLVFWIKVHHFKGARVPFKYFTNALDHGEWGLAERAFASPPKLISTVHSSLNLKWNRLSSGSFSSYLLEIPVSPSWDQPWATRVFPQLSAPNSYSWVPHQAFSQVQPSVPSPALKRPGCKLCTER